MFQFKIAAATVLIGGIVAVSPAIAVTSVYAPGSFNSEMGCAGDWDPACAQAQLTTTGGSVWTRTYTLPAGSYEYKIAYDGTWDVNYGADGVQNGANMTVASDGASPLVIRHSDITHLTNAQSSGFIGLPGTFNSEIGCSGDWDPACLQAQMFLAGDGLYYAAYLLPVGSYEYKVAYDLGWDLNYGAGGVENGANIAFDVVDPFSTVYFRYDPSTHLTSTQFAAFGSEGAVPEPATWAMMLFGFGCIGYQMRRTRRAKITYHAA